jgi:hypothetical protein
MGVPPPPVTSEERRILPGVWDAEAEKGREVPGVWCDGDAPGRAETGRGGVLGASAI